MTLSFVACGAGDDPPDVSVISAAQAEPTTAAENALRLVDDGMRRWRQRSPAPPAMPVSLRGVLREPSRAYGLTAAAGHGFTMDDGRLRPRDLPATSSNELPMNVSYPSTAAGSFALQDPQSGLSASVQLDGAAAVAAEVVGGFVVYAGGGPAGSHVVHRPRHDGTEDYLYIAQRPAHPMVSYTLTLGDRVAGLRLVANVLELVDAAGAPRLRVGARMIIDAEGDAHRVELSVAGCSIDTDRRLPWGRHPVDPGASQCRVQLRWTDSDISYPAVLDPSWTNTANMASARYGHTATLLEDGRVIVAGGNSFSTAQEQGACEIFDPQTDTWSAAGEIVARRYHTATRIKLGRVLLVGGESLAGGQADLPNQTPQIYYPASNDWGPKKGEAEQLQSIQPRRFHAALALANGTVLVTGGLGGDSDLVLKSTEKFNPDLSSSSAFSLSGDMFQARMLHTLTMASDGEIYVVGGIEGVTVRRSLERFDNSGPAALWDKAGVLSHARFLHTTTALSDGRLLVAGGLGAENSAEIFDLKPQQSTAMAMAESRFKHTATMMDDGGVVLVGGGGFDTKDNAELMDPSATDPQWKLSGPMTTGRSNHAAVLLDDGRILVTGGVDADGNATNSVEFFVRSPDGVSCAEPGDCVSELCVDGYCCDTACDGACDRCNVAGDEGRCTVLDAGSAGDPTCAPFVCDGHGATCPTSCDSHDGCTSETVCRPDQQCGSELDDGQTCESETQCVSGHCLEGICCAAANCEPYRCTSANGTCRDTCDSSADCTAGHSCDETRRCVPAPSVDALQPVGCHWAAPAPSRRGAWLGLLGAGLILRRRRKAAW